MTKLCDFSLDDMAVAMRARHAKLTAESEAACVLAPNRAGHPYTQQQAISWNLVPDLGIVLDKEKYHGCAI